MMCLYSWKARIQNQCFTVLHDCKFFCMIHELYSVASFSFILICNNAGYIAGAPRHPERIKISSMTKSFVLVVIHNKKCKIVPRRNHSFIDIQNSRFIITIIGPEFFYIIKAISKSSNEAFLNCIIFLSLLAIQK